MHSYIVVGGQVTIYSKQISEVNNSHIKLIQTSYKSKDGKEHVKLTGPHYLLVVQNSNLAHFFHDVFFPLYQLWRKDRRKVIVYMHFSMIEIDFLRCTIGDEYLIFAEYDKAYFADELIASPEGRDLRVYEDYLLVCNEIKNKCFDFYNIVENRTQNIIYSRSNQKRKKLIGIAKADCEKLGILDVDLNALNFKESLEVLASAKTFIYIVGASVFNLLFLDKSVKVLDINPLKNNSWAPMFGLADNCDYHIHIATQITPSEDARQSDPLLDANVIYDEAIESAIGELLSQPQSEHK